MAEIVPFRAVRYAASQGRALGELLAPPSDLVSQETRDELARRSPYNIIHLTFGEERPGEGAASNEHRRARELWASWLARGVLVRDPRPALYPLEQVFSALDGRQLRRHGFIGAVRLQHLRGSASAPREKAPSAPDPDRLEILKAVRANLSPILCLYRDDASATARVLDAAMAAEPAAEADSDDGVHHRLWRVEDAAVSALQDLLAPQRIFIAEGHQRYEAALEHRRQLVAQDPGLPAYGGHEYILAFLCPMNDPGLFLYPTHRLVSGLAGFSLPAFLDRLSRYFTIETLPEDVRRPAGRAWAVSKLAEHGGKNTTFLVVTAEDQKARIVTLRDDADLSGAGLPANETLASLDVTVLHSVVLRHILGLSPEAQERREIVRFARDTGEAVSRVLSGEHPIGFLLNPTPMWQVEAVGEAGETMPHKSTLFYPCLADGLVMREVDPRERP